MKPTILKRWTCGNVSVSLLKQLKECQLSNAFPQKSGIVKNHPCTVSCSATIKVYRFESFSWDISGWYFNISETKHEHFIGECA